MIYWSYYPFFQDLILRPYQKLFYGVRGLRNCSLLYIILFEYSSELLHHSSDMGTTTENFLFGGFREATTALSVVFSPDSTGASTWVTDGSSVSLDVWSSMGVNYVSC